MQHDSFYGERTTAGLMHSRLHLITLNTWWKKFRTDPATCKQPRSPRLSLPTSLSPSVSEPLSLRFFYKYTIWHKAPFYGLSANISTISLFEYMKSWFLVLQKLSRGGSRIWGMLAKAGCAASSILLHRMWPFWGTDYCFSLCKSAEVTLLSRWPQGKVVNSNLSTAPNDTDECGEVSEIHLKV